MVQNLPVYKRGRKAYNKIPRIPTGFPLPELPPFHKGVVVLLETLFGKCMMVFAMAMVPVVELRGAIVLAVGMDLPYFPALAVCVITDSGAFFVGRRLGKHKLAPRISPNKTLEGALGGSLCAVALVMLGAWLFLRDSIVWPKLLCWALTASILAQFGDLSFSTVKRLAGAKDFGTLLPGHGGILDRFDSCLFVLPFTALAVTIGGGFLT